MLDLVIGRKTHPQAIDELRGLLSDLPWRGTLYIGYPLVVLPSGSRVVDAFLSCREHGVVVFDIDRGAVGRSRTELTARHAALRHAVVEVLGQTRRLIVGGRIIVDLRVITVDLDAPGYAATVAPQTRPDDLPARRDPPARYSVRPTPGARVEPRAAEVEGRAALRTVVGLTDLLEEVQRGQPIDAATLRFVNEAVQAIANVRPARASTSIGALAGPRAAIVAEIDAEIQNMDRDQKIAAIEMPDGPQRIRGLAGTGKTIVLAFKAALLHAVAPESRILVTFWTRTMYEPLRHFITEFHRRQTRRDPDWTRLRLQHAWGDKSQMGTYREIAQYVGVEPRSVIAAKERNWLAQVFERVCDEVLAAMDTEAGELAPLYDAVLIDEAQDLPGRFFEMVYRVTRPPRRIVWAYDELQNLSEYELTSPAVLFGTDRATGRPRVPELTEADGEARSDIILPTCYRNTTWALATAHALGLGVYRRPTTAGVATGLVQFYPEQRHWEELGYEVAGSLTPGTRIVLTRDSNRSPAFFARLLTPGDAVVCRSFQTPEDEVAWVAEEASRNIADEGLTARDVLIVSANPYFKQDDAMRFVIALNARGVRARVAGQGGRRDELFGTDAAVPIANVLRAKGNESAMVYVVQAEHAADRREVVKRRNALFTAITRSRAWVRISGSGPDMAVIEEEVRQVVARGHRLELEVPSERDMARIRRLQRDMTRRERRLVARGRAGIAALADLAREDDALVDTAVDSLSTEERDALRALLRRLETNSGR